MPMADTDTETGGATAWLAELPLPDTLRDRVHPLNDASARPAKARYVLCWLQQALRAFLTPLFSNAPILGSIGLDDPARSQGHSIVDLGADELTVGRLHPMIDQDLRLRRLRQEASDPDTGLLLLDDLPEFLDGRRGAAGLGRMQGGGSE